MKDIIIIGAGPAGMSAANVAAKHGADVLVLDEARSPGGQIYRAIEKTGNLNRPELGKTYPKGAGLVSAFRKAQIDYVPQASVWQVSPELEVGYSVNGAAHLVFAKQIILAGGALERPMPVPGWTLPGVMTAGSAQIMLKQSGLAIEGAVFAGTGPLLYLIVHQYLTAGIPVKAVIDLTPKSNYFKALRHLPGALRAASSIIEGIGWKREIAKSGAEFIQNVSDIRIIGTDNVEGIEYLKGGGWHRIACKNVALHQGVTPNLNISLAAGCARHWNARQACWNITVDDWLHSSVEGVFVAGDGAGIGGAVAAENQGAIAALGALQRLGKLDLCARNDLAKPFQKALHRELSARPFLEALFRPIEATRIPQNDETIVCRCEEITVGDIKKRAAEGHNSPNQLKSFSRCGMGPCQGRLCGLTVSEMMAKLNQTSVEAAGYYRLRTPLKPLPLSELASLAKNAP